MIIKASVLSYFKINIILLLVHFVNIKMRNGLFNQTNIGCVIYVYSYDRYD